MQRHKKHDESSDPKQVEQMNRMHSNPAWKNHESIREMMNRE